jgi:hypothetical protein
MTNRCRQNGPVRRAFVVCWRAIVLHAGTAATAGGGRGSVGRNLPLPQTAKRFGAVDLHEDLVEVIFVAVAVV